MEKETTSEEIFEDLYDSAERLFDFVGADEQTAIICELDEAVRENIGTVLKGMDYQITEASSSKEAFRNMRYHAFELVIVNERFDADDPDGNGVLQYLENLPMSVRRAIFVVLISDKFRTMDNMTAFNKSVNMIINSQNMGDLETILNRGIAINEVFYNVFKEAQRKTGRA